MMWSHNLWESLNSGMFLPLNFGNWPDSLAKNQYKYPTIDWINCEWADAAGLCNTNGYTKQSNRYDFLSEGKGGLVLMRSSIVIPLCFPSHQPWKAIETIDSHGRINKDNNLKLETRPTFSSSSPILSISRDGLPLRRRSDLFQRFHWAHCLEAHSGLLDASFCFLPRTFILCLQQRNCRPPRSETSYLRNKGLSKNRNSMRSGLAERVSLMHDNFKFS